MYLRYLDSYGILYQELMSRPKGGEGASDCVADVLGKVLDVHILIWKMPLDAYQISKIHVYIS